MGTSLVGVFGIHGRDARAMEDGADADGLQEAVLFGVHALKGGVLVVVEAEAVERAVEDVEEEFVLDRERAGGGLAAGLIHAGEDVHIEGFALSGGPLGEVECEDVGGAGDLGELHMGVGHFVVGDETDADFTGAAESGDYGVGFGAEGGELGGDEERPGIGNVHDQSRSGMAGRGEPGAHGGFRF